MSVQSNPSYEWEAITPDNSVSYGDKSTGRIARAIYVGGDGDLVAVDQNGNAVTFTGVKAGTILPIRTIRVNATSTTATNLVALW